MLIKFYPYACWLMCCLLLGTASCSNNEEQIEEPVTQQPSAESKSKKNYAVVFGDTIDIVDYEFRVIQDSFEIVQIDSLDAISYCGKFGYVLAVSGSGEKRDMLRLFTKDLQTGKILKSAQLKDIILKSKFAQDLEGFQDSRHGNYYFNYDDFYGLYSSTRGLVLAQYWSSGLISGSGNYSASMYLFVNNNLELEQFVGINAPYSHSNFFIVLDKIIHFAYIPSIRGIVHTSEKVQNITGVVQIDLDWSDAVDYFDFKTKDTYKKISQEIIIATADSAEYSIFGFPDVMIDKKFLYLDYIHQNAILIADIQTKKAALITSDLLSTPPIRWSMNASFEFIGYSEQNIYVKIYNSDFTSVFSEKPPIYAIPRKILDYAD